MASTSSCKKKSFIRYFQKRKLVMHIGKWKTLLGIFVGTVFGAFLLNFIKGKPVTWHFVVFVTVFMAIIISLTFLLDYLFGERIRRNPRTLMIILAVCWALLLISATGSLIKNYTAGKEIDWLSVFAGAAALIAGIGWFRYVRLQKKR